MKYCSFCGSVNADEASFCSGCGAHLVQTAQEDVVTAYPEKKPKKTWTKIVAGVLVLAMIATATWYFFLRTTDEKKEPTVSEALQSSIGQLEDLFLDAPNFKAFLDASKQFDQSKYSLQMDMQIEEETVYAGTKVLMHMATESKIVSGCMEYNISRDDRTINLPINFAICEDELQIQMPTIFDRVLRQENEDEFLPDFGSLGFLTNPKATIDNDTAKTLWQQLLDSVESTSVTEQTYQLPSGEFVCQRHEVTCDKEALEQLKEGLLSNALSSEEDYEDLFEEEPLSFEGIDNFALLVQDGLCIGFSLDFTEGDETYREEMLLAGARNPWSDIYCFTDGEQSSRIKTTSTQGEIIIEIMDEDEIRRIVIDDVKQEIRVEGDEYDSTAIGYGVEGESLIFRMDLMGNFVTCRMMPLAQQPEMLSDEPVNIEDLTEEEQEELFQKLMELLAPALE
ncbi:MAG: hypothetical protein E7467_07085 [Ruminococcaceae bacterium]|nr:hypothetical protein [Oscillospiraceae bacterium]